VSGIVPGSTASATQAPSGTVMRRPLWVARGQGSTLGCVRHALLRAAALVEARQARLQHELPQSMALSNLHPRQYHTFHPGPRLRDILAPPLLHHILSLSLGTGCFF
jgi:hypothetical protein